MTVWAYPSGLFIGDFPDGYNTMEHVIKGYMGRNRLMASVEVKKHAPDFEMKDFKGDTFKLSAFKGHKNVLIVLNRGFV